MSSKKKVQIESEPVAEVTTPEGTSQPEAPIAPKKAGRRPFPRDENGKIVRPEGYQPKSRKVAPVELKLTFENGRLVNSNGAEWLGGHWVVDGYTADGLTAEIEAAEAALADLHTRAEKLVGLPELTREVASKLDTDSLFAWVDSQRK